MSEEKILVNRVANSGIITIDLEDYYPQSSIYSFDIKDYLFQGLILREKDFREALKIHDWSKYQGGILCVFCSTDAIIPVWAYMLVASLCSVYEIKVFSGTKEDYLKYYYQNQIENIDPALYQNQKIVIKGCSNKPVPSSAYLDIVAKIQSKVQSIMYGEPCSTVPIYKRPKASE